MDKKDPFVLRHLADVQPDLWWLDSDPLEPAPHSALIGDIGADLCVVGAGYTGLWTALLAKERDPDREVVVVEQYETGAGASGRNGGFCSASLTHGYLNGVRRFPDEIELIQRLGRENLDEIEATMRRYDIQCDFERTGELQVAVAPWQFKGMAEQAQRRNAMGDTVEVLSQEEVQSRVHSPSYVGALFDHDGTALVDPARLVWGLEKVCIAKGVKIFENSKVEWLEDLHDAVRIHTPYGAVTAARVALGTNVFPSLLEEDAQVRGARLRLRHGDRAAQRGPTREHRVVAPRGYRRLGQPVPLLPPHERQQHPLGWLRHDLQLSRQGATRVRVQFRDLRDVGRTLPRRRSPSWRGSSSRTPGVARSTPAPGSPPSGEPRTRARSPTSWATPDSGSPRHDLVRPSCSTCSTVSKPTALD